MRVDISEFALQNVEKTADGLRTRRGLQLVRAPSNGTEYIAGFSVDDRAGNVWHYLVERSTSSGTAIVYVYSDNDVVTYSGLLSGTPLLSFRIGPVVKDCPISMAVVFEQLYINSPSFAPIFGLVAGPLVTATPVDSDNPATTAIDIPSGHVCRVNDRIVIAAGQSAFVAEPRDDIGQRTFSANSRISRSSAIHSAFQGPDGALWLFTSADACSIPPDAFSQGQEPAGFINELPGEGSHGPLRAGASHNGVIRLTQRGFRRLPDGEDVELDPYNGKRRLGMPVGIPDFSQSGRVYSYDSGYLIAVKGKGFWYDVNERLGYVSLVWIEDFSHDLVGVLRGRSGEPMPVTAGGVLASHGWVDTGNKSPHGILMGNVSLGPEADRRVRRMFVSTDNIALPIKAATGSKTSSKYTRARASEHSIDSGDATLWIGRAQRRTQFSFGERQSEINLEIQVDGGDYSIDRFIELELVGKRVRP